jgi:hypothetical protein
MISPARPDPARIPCLYGDVRPSLAPSGASVAIRRHVRRLASSAMWPRRPRHPVPWWAVVSAGLSPVLATGGWLMAGAVQPASYSPIRQTVSVMAGYAGTDRWIMTGALFLVGACQLVAAVGLAGFGVPARILLAVAGLCSIGIAESPEPAIGSTPQHLAWTSLGAVTLAVWPAFVARRAPPRPLILSGYSYTVVTAVFMALLGWLVIQTQGGRDLGLSERLFLSIETCWPFIVAIALRQVGLGVNERWRVPPGEAGERAERDGRQVGDGPVQQHGGCYLRSISVAGAGQDGDQSEFGDAETAGGNGQHRQQPDEREGGQGGLPGDLSLG